nr:PREDICTED: uncharacterized protein LOC109458016 [Rhinolophus sinicus]
MGCGKKRHFIQESAGVPEWDKVRQKGLSPQWPLPQSYCKPVSNGVLASTHLRGYRQTARQQSLNSFLPSARAEASPSLLQQKSKFPRNDHPVPDLCALVAEQSWSPGAFDGGLLKTGSRIPGTAPMLVDSNTLSMEQGKEFVKQLGIPQRDIDMMTEKWIVVATVEVLLWFPLMPGEDPSARCVQNRKFQPSVEQPHTASQRHGDQEERKPNSQFLRENNQKPKDVRQMEVIAYTLSHRTPSCPEPGEATEGTNGAEDSLTKTERFQSEVQQLWGLWVQGQ